MRIKFFAGGIDLHQRGNKRLFVNSSYWCLRHYNNIYGKNKDVTWLMPEYLSVYTLDEAIEIIKNDNVDILCLSMFIWSYDFHIELAKKIKSIQPNIKIIMGGPELTAHKKPGFLKQHPYVDFVVYGDGEQAFTQLIDYISGTDTDKSKWINIVEVNNEKEVVYPYQRFTDQEYYSRSLYIEQENFILRCLEYTNEQLNKYYKKGNHVFVIPVEFTRGCMYSCTFCDWSQNLTKKVIRAKRNFFKDIDFFHKHDIAITDADANFGQYKEDIEIFDYALSKYDPSKNFMFAVINLPKLKKSASEHIMKLQLERFPITQAIAMQDMDDEVLKNIDRPSISLTEHFNLINRIKEGISVEAVKKLEVQLMIGLPGQNLANSTNNIIEMIHNTGIKNFSVAIWELLANSPANDKLYLALHKLKFDKVYYLNHTTIAGHDLDWLYSTAAGNIHNTKLFKCHKAEIVQSGHFTWWEMQILRNLYILLRTAPESLFKNKDRAQLENIVYRLYRSSKQKINNQIPLHQPFIEKYNIRIVGHYDPVKKIMYNTW